MRTVLAVLGGGTFLGLWIVLAVNFADRILGLNMALQFIYFALAGLAWTAPIGWLMVWAARRNGQARS